MTTNDKNAAFAPITIEGRKGMKSVWFSKTFKTEAAMDKWLEANEGNITIDRYSTEA